MSGDATRGPGSRHTHKVARKRLRQRLEAQGASPEAVETAVEELRRRQAAQRAVGKGKFSQKNRQRIRQRLRERDGDRCLICGGCFTEDDPATIDHVKPRVAGGTNALENLRLAHRSCNHIRGQGQDPHIDGRTGKPHPRAEASA